MAKLVSFELKKARGSLDASVNLMRWSCLSIIVHIAIASSETVFQSISDSELFS